VEGKLKRSPTKAKSLGAGSTADLDDDIALPVPRVPISTEKGSMLSSFKRVNSFAPANKDGLNQQPQRRQPFSKSDSLLIHPLPPSKQPTASCSGSNKIAKTFFAGKRFRALGEARCLNVKTVVEGSGGSWIIEDDEDVDFVIVRLVR
jgi:DNA replication regulator DPB11